MFVPLYDGVPLRYLRFPIGNWSIIAVNVIVFLLLQAAPDPNRLETGLRAIPAVLFGTAILSPDLAIVPPPATLITGIFVHAEYRTHPRQYAVSLGLRRQRRGCDGVGTLSGLLHCLRCHCCSYILCHGPDGPV